MISFLEIFIDLVEKYKKGITKDDIFEKLREYLALAIILLNLFLAYISTDLEHILIWVDYILGCFSKADLELLMLAYTGFRYNFYLAGYYVVKDEVWKEELPLNLLFLLL